MKVGSLLADFEAYLLAEKRSSLNTVKAYLRDVQFFLEALQNAGIKLGCAKSEHVEAFVQSEARRQVSPRTVARRVAALKTLARFLHHEKRTSLPLDSLVSPRWAKPLPQCLTEQEIKAIFSCASQDATDRGIRNQTMLLLLYSLGLRVSELISLKIGQLRLDEGFINVIGKGQKERCLPLDPVSRELLGRYLVSSRQRLLEQWSLADSRSQKGGAVQELPFLFFAKNRSRVGPLTRQAVSMMFRRIARQALVTKSVSPHIMRHSIATHLLGRGADLRTLQSFLGHGTIATVQIYTHVEMGRLRATYDQRHPRSGQGK